MCVLALRKWVPSAGATSIKSVTSVAEHDQMVRLTRGCNYQRRQAAFRYELSLTASLPKTIRLRRSKLKHMTDHLQQACDEWSLL